MALEGATFVIQTVKLILLRWITTFPTKFTHFISPEGATRFTWVNQQMARKSERGSRSTSLKMHFKLHFGSSKYRLTFPELQLQCSSFSVVVTKTFFCTIVTRIRLFIFTEFYLKKDAFAVQHANGMVSPLIQFCAYVGKFSLFFFTFLTKYPILTKFDQFSAMFDLQIAIDLF